MINFLLLIIIIHRISVVILFVTSFVILFIPNIFPKLDDLDFSIRILSRFYTYRSIFLGITILSGTIRLLFGIPNGLILKLLAVILTIIVLRNREKINSTSYKRTSAIQLLSIMVTGLIGLFL